MEQTDATHAAVGGILFGVGSVALSILIPLAAAAQEHPWTEAWFLAPVAIGGACGLGGLYLVAAVYRGWPLPSTASEREFAPKLRFVEAHVLMVEGGDVVFQVAFVNDGRGNVHDALINVIVPNFFGSLRRCAEDGSLGHHAGAGSKTPESLVGDDDGNPIPSIYWNGNVTFPGRRHRLIYFRGPMEPLRDFPIRLNVTAIELKKELEAGCDLAIPESGGGTEGSVA